jgi:hypothetical protein
MTKSGKMRLWSPLLLGLTMTAAAGFAAPAFANGCNGFVGYRGCNGFVGYNGYNGCNGFAGYRGCNGFVGYNGFNDGYAYVREPVVGFRTRVVPRCNGYYGYSGFNGYGYVGFPY